MSSSSKQLLLPHDLVEKILHRLPTKSLLRFRCVCKSWHSLINDPSFIYHHFHHSHSSFLLYQSYHTDYIRGSRLLDPFSVTLSYGLPRFHSHPDTSSLVGICHGLVCISTDNHIYDTLVICNPSLRRFLSLPKPFPIPYPSFIKNFGTAAFGFDSRNHDYKIVRILSGSGIGSHYINHINLRDKISYSRVDIYSLASGVWRTLSLPPALADPQSSLCEQASPGFDNGLAHWVVRRWLEEDQKYSFSVLSFNFVDQVFHEVGLPMSITQASFFEWDGVTVVGDIYEKTLTVFCLSDSLPWNGSVWLMKEYGVVESWTKIFEFSSVQAPSFGISIDCVDLQPKPLSVTHNGDILMQMHNNREEHLCLLDMEKKRFVDFQISSNTWMSRSAHYYAESLVLLNNTGALPY